MSVLFLSPPNLDELRPGANVRYQAHNEAASFWYPTRLAQSAALVNGSRLLDCPPLGMGLEECLRVAAGFDQIIIHTTTPSLENDYRVAEAIKRQSSTTRIGMIGAHAAVLPTETLKSSNAIDWVGRREFDFTCKEVGEGLPLESVPGLSYKREGRIYHNAERELIGDMDALPWVADVYRRDLDIRRYNINYLQHPYISLSTGRGCPAEDADCLWLQTTGEHPYRVRSAQNVTEEVAYMKRLFPGVKEFFFEDDTFTSNVSRALEIAGLLGSLGVTWSCRSRPNLEEKSIRKLKSLGLRLFLVNYESGNEFILRQTRKGVTVEQMRRFTQICHRVGVRIHGRFILGLPIETPESIENTIRFAQELDIYSIQVSLAMPYPGTDLYELARQNGWLVRNNQDRWGLTNGDHRGDPLTTGLSKDEVFENIERFYHRYYLRPKPILRMLKTMLEDRGVFVQRCQNGVELIRSIGKHRKVRD